MEEYKGWQAPTTFDLSSKREDLALALGSTGIHMGHRKHGQQLRVSVAFNQPDGLPDNSGSPGSQRGESVPSRSDPIKDGRIKMI